MKILSLNGLLGYGYDRASLDRAMTMDIDVVGVDAGSTDPGPYYLGSGSSFTNRDAVKRDVALVLPWAIEKHIPFIIGTAGGSGAKPHVAWLEEIIREIAAEHGLSFTIAVVETQVDAEYVLGKMAQNKVRSFSDYFPLTAENVERCTNIVSQVGVDSIISALKTGADVVLCGRCCDTAIYAAPAIMNGMDEGLAIHMAKIMECGALCAEPMAASDCMVAQIAADHFILEPASLDRRCTVERVAAHTMYEQGNPYYIYEPDGMADLKESRYEQLDERRVRVSNSKFVPAKTPTLKLEGSMPVGFRSIAIAGVNDPETIRRMDAIFAAVKDFVSSSAPESIAPERYRLHLHSYGLPLDGRGWGGRVPDTGLGVILEVVADTQEISRTILALARAKLLHTDYAGRKSTAGNLAFPFSPSDIACGPVYNFGIYHLVEVDDLCETTKITVRKVGA